MKGFYNKLKFYGNLCLVFLMSIMLLKPASAQQITGLQTNIIVEKTENEADFLVIDVVFYKVSIDDGGYEQTYLKMAESPYKRQ